MKADIKNIFSLGKFYLIGSILQKSLPFFLLPLYTSYLTPADYGLLSLLTILVSWPGKLIGAPVGNGITRHYHDPTMKGSQGEMIFSGWLFTLLQSLVFCLVFIFLHDIIAEKYLGDAAYGNVVFMFAFVMLTRPIGTLMLSLLRIQSKARFYVKSNLIVFITSAILQVVLLVFFEMGILAMVWGAIYAAFARLFILLPYTWGSLDFKFNWKALKSILHFGYPLIIAAFVGVASTTMDRILINHYFDLATVGLLAFALKIPIILEFTFSTPFKHTIVPIIYEKETDKEEQLKFVKKMTTYVVFSILVITLGLSLFSREIIMLVASNSDFYESWKVVPLLLFATANGGAAIMFGNGMAMAKKSFMISLTSFYVFVVNVTLLLIFVPSMGLIGVGIASASAFTFRNIIRGYYSHKYYGQSFELKKIIVITLIAIAIYFSTLLFSHLPMLYGIPLKILFLIAYPLIIWNSSLINQSDKLVAKKQFRKLLMRSQNWFFHDRKMENHE